MSKKLQHIDPEVLIGRYLAGEANKKEVRYLEKWVKESPANQQLFLSTRKAFNLAGPVDQKALNIDASWAKVEQQIETNSNKIEQGRTIPFRRGRARLLRVAAAVIVLLAALFWWYENNYQPGVEYFQSDATVLIDELPDGSVISLNRKSRITFEQDQERKVKLVGDAFFEVKRDETRPFIVEAGDLEVQVLGTSFYINAQSKSPNVEVMVKSGRVAVKYGQDSVAIGTGGRASFNKRSKKLIHTTIEDINYLSWKTKELVFEDERLDWVVDKINEVYDANVVLGGRHLEKCPITVTFKQQDLDAVLTVIAETLNLTVVEKGDKRVLEGSKCR